MKHEFVGYVKLKATRDISKKTMAFCSLKQRPCISIYFPLNAPRENHGVWTLQTLETPGMAFWPQTNKTNRIFSVAEKSCKAQGRDDNL